MSIVPWWTDAATPFADSVDTLFWTMTGVSGAMTALIFGLIWTFGIRYRRRAARDRALDVAVATGTHTRAIEFFWITVPLLVFVVFFVWSARLFRQYENAPAGAVEVYVVAKQWMWLIEHPNGRREIDELHVPIGRDVRLVMTSQDVIHSFFVPAFRVKRDVLPDRFTELWFRPTVVGDFHLFCAEFCGTDHSRMHGVVHVMKPEDYARWLQAGAEQPPLAAAGAAKFEALGCRGCHDEKASIRAPDLAGLFGRTIPLAGGRWVVVDERYVRASILSPGADIAVGYEPIMPSYAGRVSEQEMLELIAYLKSLAPTPAGGAGGA